MYFLEPTSVEIDSETRFTVSLLDNQLISYKPDPTVYRQVFPGLPNGAKPLDGESLQYSQYLPTIINKFRSANIDFFKKGVRPGDILVIDFVELKGDYPISGIDANNQVSSLAGRYIELSINDQPEIQVVFMNDVSTDSSKVSLDGIVTQINTAVGVNVCSIVTNGSDKYLKFSATFHIIIRKEGSANSNLGFSIQNDSDNLSKNAGRYVTVADITNDTSNTIYNTLMLDTNKKIRTSGQQFTILRKGAQRISSTQMDQNVTDGGFYYWDVELVSEGTGNLWNIDEGEVMVPSGYRSDGYYLVTKDSNLTFSTAEDLQLHLSKSILEVGVDDDPDNAIQLRRQSILINYEFSPLVEQVQSFVLSEGERVVKENPLARQLILTLFDAA